MENTQNNKSERSLKEEKILSFWKENQIFEKTLQNKGPEVVFYDGPPFATGLPHYGHILPGTIKDVLPRYKTMQGYRVPRRWGWDCHGLPIENLIEKELGLETKKDIEKFGIAEFNKRARESVLRYEKEWKEIIPRTGRFIDMDNAYKTLDSSYTESVWWSFKNLFDKGLVYQGFKSMHLCPRCETTLSNFEVNQGYKDITDISVYVKFELLDEPGTYLVAWTTTPWTLPGNVALAVNEDIQYVEVKTESANLILAEDRLSVLKDLKFEKLKTFSGKELVGKRYKTIFDYYLKESKVYGASFVKAEEGTGIVHIAPAFGDEDYELSLKENLPFVQHVGTDGHFKSEVRDFVGLMAKPKDDHQATDIEIIKHLAHHNILLSKEKIIHSYPHCWRCDTPLLNYASSSWFVKVTDIKEKLLAQNKKVKWVPEEIGEGRFGKWLEGARDWAVSRSRFWGAPLPVWQNADKTKSLVIDSIASLKKHAKKSNNTFLFVRHGEAEHNVLDICSSDPKNPHHLTEKGREHVKALAQKLKSEKIDVVIRSPYVRAEETTDIIAEAISFNKSQIKVDERVGEYGFGEFNLKPWSEYLLFRKGNEFDMDFKVPGGESLQEAKNRFGKFIEDVDSQYSNKKILVVTHGIGFQVMKAIVEALDTKASAEAIRSTFRKIPDAHLESYVLNNLPHNEKFELDLHRPHIDEVVLEIDGEEYKRIPEVFDTWYDSGSVPFASLGLRTSRPADFIAEGLDQTRGWFYTMAVLGTALFGEFPYKQVTVNGMVLAEDGKKMSKRLKNYPELTDVLNKYGADALRFHLLSSPAVRADDISFSERGLEEVMKKNLNRLDNVLSFYELYGGEKIEGDKNNNVLDSWIEERLNELVSEVTEYLEKFEIDRALRPIPEFIDDLSTWYLRRSRTRPEALPKLREVLITLSRILAPFTPFMAEDMYLRLKGGKESVHLESWPKVSKSIFSKFFASNKDGLEKMAETRRLVSLALELRQKANIKVRQPLQSLSIKTHSLSEEYLEIIKDELNVKEILIEKDLNEEISLNTTLTPELIEEGKMREVIRAIQEWRKEKNLTPGEVVEYPVPEESKEIFSKFASEIKKATSVEF